MTRFRHPAKNIVPLWLWPNLLGLDSPLVAVSWQWLFARAFGIPLPTIFHLILGLSVWCVYLADRLWDVIRAENIENATDRLRFTKRNFIPLTLVMFLAGSVNLYLIIQHVPKNLVISGLATAGLLAIYYTFRMFGRGKITIIVPREVLCGMIFALGSVISVDFFEGPAVAGMGFILPTILLGLVCSAACILISIWERDADLEAADRSIATQNPSVPGFLPGVISLLAIVCIGLAFIDSWQIYLAITLSAAALRLALHFEKHLSVATLRVLADGVLLSPLVVIFFA